MPSWIDTIRVSHQGPGLGVSASWTAPYSAAAAGTTSLLERFWYEVMQLSCINHRCNHCIGLWQRNQEHTVQALAAEPCNTWGIGSLCQHELYACTGADHSRCWHGACCRTTEVPPDMVEQLVADVQPRYRPQDYNLLFNNCNHFTNELGLLLTGEGLPVSDTASLQSSPSTCTRADYPVCGLH